MLTGVDHIAFAVSDLERSLRFYRDQLGLPVVVRLEGTNRDEGARILKESGLDIRFAHSMREAGELAVGMIKSDA